MFFKNQSNGAVLRGGHGQEKRKGSCSRSINRASYLHLCINSCQCQSFTVKSVTFYSSPEESCHCWWNFQTVTFSFFSSFDISCLSTLWCNLHLVKKQKNKKEQPDYGFTYCTDITPTTPPPPPPHPYFSLLPPDISCEWHVMWCDASSFYSLFPPQWWTKFYILNSVFPHRRTSRVRHSGAYSHF